MAYQPICTGEENFNVANVKNNFRPSEYLNTSYAISREIHNPTEHITTSSSDSALNLQRGHFASQQRSGKRKVSTRSTELAAMPLVSPSHGLLGNEVSQSPNGEIPLGPRGGRKGKKVHVCEHPNCEKVCTRLQSTSLTFANRCLDLYSKRASFVSQSTNLMQTIANMSRRHEKSHSDANDNFCKICNQKLSRDDTYKNHLATRKSVDDQGS